MLRPAPRRLSSLVSLGAIVGFSAGLFGIGGGVVLVPLLLRVFRFPLATAAGTSVAAILPAALTGGITYALQGFVDLQAALFLMIGIVLGAQLGSYLLARVNQNLIKTTFMIFLVLTAASLWVVVPNRADSIVFNLYTALALVCVGFISGALSGAIGIGGGVIIVPVLMFFFGASDLIAKGTSLVILIPGSLSGTISNAIRNNVDLATAMVIGCTSALVVPLGSYLSVFLAPAISNIIFSLLILGIFGQMLNTRSAID